MLRTLFKEMNEGRKDEISVILRRKLLKFNGGLFADNTVLPVNGTQLGILKAAAALTGSTLNRPFSARCLNAR